MNQVHCVTQVSHRLTRGVAVEIVNYRWDAYASVTVTEPDITVRWRLSPCRVRMRGATSSRSQSHIGRLTMHQSGDPYVAVADKNAGMATLLQCRLSEEWLQPRLGDNWIILKEYLASSLDVRDQKIDYVMRLMAQELTEPQAGSAAMIETALTMLGLNLARHAELARDRQAKCRCQDVRISKIKAFITNSEEIVSLASIAAEFGLSVAHLRRIFKDNCGITLHGFIEKTKYERAGYLLTESEYPLKSIAHLLGYKQASAFSFAFRRSTGLTPGAFRHQARLFQMA